MVASPEPHATQQVRIPLADGCVLHGRLWLPDGDAPAPLILEWIPYRQSDATAVGDSMLHGWFAGHGLACLRVDIRGSGNSGGILQDEYVAQEQDDAVAVIAWAAAQPWCTGAVGMIGISWGGFAALQVAARRPPALKAIITACSTDDRHADDVHFMGGALLNDGLSWGSGLFGQLLRPPDPAHAGPGWRDVWLQRMAALEPPLATWLAHPVRDAYWRHGSVAEDYAAIACPVMAVGGWTDGYCNAILRLLAGLEVPRQGLIGPWTHVYPNWGVPGPAIGFLRHALRWWRRWLLDEPNGIDAEPMLTAWLGRDLVPDPQAMTLGGHWLRIPHWPAPAERVVLHGGEGTLAPHAENALPPVLVDTPQYCGGAGGEWCPLDGGGSAPEFQADQRLDDGLSVTFDSVPLGADQDVLGRPVLELDIAMTGETALLAARLCEVRDDGTSARVTFGLLRVSRPPDVAAGARFPLRLELKAAGYRLARGRRVRLALSNAYWPMAWPEARACPLTVWPGSIRLELPQPPAGTEAADPGFGPPEEGTPLAHRVLEREEATRIASWNQGSGRHELVVSYRRRTLELGELVFGGSGEERYGVDARDPAGASASFVRRNHFRRPGWAVRTQATTRVTREEGRFRLQASVAAYESEGRGSVERRVFLRAWDMLIDPEEDKA
ncbi:CocE/NonD family hydrolase [Zavarzinia sp. CC-PAN008]|uniref:CocE/NonD family hydrolase n=1 Tax=Zavarzinia sp. CC-PAN008 TaxID=3243332 RepID=UPI003F74536A